MGRIVVLDDNMINMIAAGEVIERPASVLKELLENSIDAGAGRIVLRVEDGGRKLISVTDDGCGMDAGDLQRAFLPHATSKIRTSDDLVAIKTMGFRGEALASIAAVSQISAVSRPADSVEASRIDIDCGSPIQSAPCSGDYGTSFEVRNLFCKLPARRKFLRTANTEMAHITEHFTRIALAHCKLDMTLIHNGRQLHHLLGNQTVTERIAQLLGRGLADDLLETNSTEKGLSIHALLGKPATARATGKFQYIFLNRRYIRDRFIGHAIKEAYRGLIEPNKYPVAFLFLQIPPELFDVNVHPTKIEVRFQNANLVHSQVLAVIRQRLLADGSLDVTARMPTHPGPHGSHGSQGPQGSPASLPQNGPAVPADQLRKERIAEAMANFFKTGESSDQRQFGFSGHGQGQGQGQGHYQPQPGQTDPSGFPPVGPVTIDTAGRAGQAEPQKRQTTSPQAGVFLQVHNSYIVTQSDEGFVIIDQHALHERIIYEDLCRKITSGPLESQRLLIPETFDITDAQLEAINDNTELLEKLGVELAPFGPRTMAIQAFPTLLAGANPLDFVLDMLDMLTDGTLGLDAERLLHKVLDMAACKSAIKAGQPLTDSEMAQLLADKDTVQRASRCPHGRPTTIRFTLAELEKQFKRTGF